MRHSLPYCRFNPFMTSVPNQGTLENCMRRLIKVYIICIKTGYSVKDVHNKTNKRVKMTLYRSPDYQTSFESINVSVQKKNLNIDFQDGGHLGFPIKMI